VPTAACRVRILAPTPRITSTTGIVVDRHAPLEAASEADAVYFCSGEGSRTLADNAEIMAKLRLNETRQILAAIDSGAILLARLGHLRGRRATTYPGEDLESRLVADGAFPTEAPLVIEGNVAT